MDLCDGILICSMTSVLDSCWECVEKMQHDLMFEVTALQEHQHKFATTKFIPCLCSQSGIFLSSTYKMLYLLLRYLALTLTKFFWLGMHDPFSKMDGIAGAETG